MIEEAPLPTRLRALARDLGRLQPSRRDPESYFAKKSEIVEGLRQAAREADWTRPPVRSAGTANPPRTAARPAVISNASTSTSTSTPATCRHCRRRRAAQSRRHRL